MFASCTPFRVQQVDRLLAVKPSCGSTRDSATRPTSTLPSLGMMASELQACCRVENQSRCQSLSGTGRRLHILTSRVVRIHSSWLCPLSLNRSVSFQMTYTGAQSRSSKPYGPTPDNAHPRITYSRMPKNEAPHTYAAIAASTAIEPTPRRTHSDAPMAFNATSCPSGGTMRSAARSSRSTSRRCQACRSSRGTCCRTRA